MRIHHWSSSSKSRDQQATSKWTCNTDNKYTLTLIESMSEHQGKKEMRCVETHSGTGAGLILLPRLGPWPYVGDCANTFLWNSRW